PLPYADSERLVSVWLTAPGFNIEKLELSAADYFTFREEGQTFQDFGVWTIQPVSINEGEMPPIRKFKFIGPDYFRTLGSRLLVGRDFSWRDLHDKRPVVI